MGATDSPNRIGHERAGVGKTITAPNGAPSRILIRDTWNTEILDELKPEPGDVVLYKNRFSGFHQTDLDAILKKKRIRHLIFTGCTTGVCVESTVRDAIFRDYAAVMLADCTAEPSGFEMTHNATLTLIEKRLFGSVSSSDEFVRALIYELSGPGKPARRLTDEPGLDYGAAPSPDGRWLAFTSERRGNADLFVLDLERGGPARLFVDSDAMEDQAVISPDGKTIVFVSSREGNAEMFSLPFQPERTQSLKRAKNLTRHPGGDFRPAFSPDGNRISADGLFVITTLGALSLIHPLIALFSA